MAYNIFLDSPQLAYQANQRKQLQKIIRKNAKLQNAPLPRKYPNTYYLTSYSRFITSNASLTPGY